MYKSIIKLVDILRFSKYGMWNEISFLKFSEHETKRSDPESDWDFDFSQQNIPYIPV